MTRMQQADETNRQIRANAERAKVYDQMVEVANVTARQTRELEDIENRRTAMLQKAELPMPELSITEDGELLYKGQKWDCMSGSERLKVATGICMKSKPGCGFVLIDGLEAMDPQTLAEFAEFLTEQNMQGIGTIVGDTAATVIIEDGMVQQKEPTTEHNAIQNQKCESPTNPKEE
jgi:ABC-type lipopolysaccharide export system ATPase subunit